LSAHSRSKTSASIQTPSHLPHSSSNVAPISSRCNAALQPGHRAAASCCSDRAARAPHLGQNFAPWNISPKHDGQLMVASRASQ
jgi:hypothetical protein